MCVCARTPARARACGCAAGVRARVRVGVRVRARVRVRVRVHVRAEVHFLRMWMHERVRKRKERGIQGERVTGGKEREVLRDRDGEFRNYYRSSPNGENNNWSVVTFRAKNFL